MITPQQILEARAPSRCVGWANRGPMFKTLVAPDVLARVQELSTVAGESVPPWSIMDLAGTSSSGIWVATTTPEWFLDLAERLRTLRGG